MILAIRTDKPEAELYLLKEDGVIIDQYVWTAHRELSNTLLSKIENILSKNSRELTDIIQVIVYKGPGSFTGLRIGITVANTLGYVLAVPVVGRQGEDWLMVPQGDSLPQKELSMLVIPNYGAEANVTAPRK